jgi:hypothetical protein
MMKKFLIFLGGLALLGAAAVTQAQTTAPAPMVPAAPTPPAAAVAEPQAGFVKSVRGNVQLLTTRPWWSARRRGWT